MIKNLISLYLFFGAFADIDLCEQYKQMYDIGRRLPTMDALSGYCTRQCDTIPEINCDLFTSGETEIPGSSFYNDMYAFMNGTFYNFANEARTGEIPAHSFDRLRIYELFKYLRPAMSLIIPIVSSNTLKGNYQSMTINAIYCVVIFFLYSNTRQLVVIHNLGLTLLFHCGEQYRSNGIFSGFGIILFMSFAMVIITDWWVQGIVITSCMAMFVTLCAKTCLSSKGGDKLLFIVYLLELLILIDIFTYFSELMGEKSVPIRILLLVSRSVFPFGGTLFSHWLDNARVGIDLLLAHIEVHAPEFYVTYGYISIVMAVIFTKGFFFLAFRFMIGIFLLKKASPNHEITFDSAMHGFFMYSCNILDPFIQLPYVLSSFSNPRKRVMTLTVFLLVIINTFEILYAVDWIYFRICCVLFDFATTSGRSSYLCAYTSIGAQFMTSFPTAGLPWLDTAKIDEIHNATYTLYVKLSNNEIIRGTGFLRGEKGNRVSLVTVRHVLRDAVMVTLKKHGVNVHSFQVNSNDIVDIGDPSSVDPSVSLRIVNPDLATCEIPYNTHQSILGIRAIAAVNALGYFCMSDTFRKNGKGDVSTLVSLDFGDSGAPCFGILANGSMVLVGVVSRGTSNGMNVLSMIDTESYEVSSGSDDDYQTDYGTLQQLEELEAMSVSNKQHHESCAAFDEESLSTVPEEENEGTDQNLNKQYGPFNRKDEVMGSSDEDEAPRDNDQERRDDDERHHNKRKNKTRIKNPRKEQARRKRMARRVSVRSEKTAAFKAKLGLVYGPGEKFDAYVKRFTNGDIVHFNRKRGHEIFHNYDSSTKPKHGLSLDDFAS